MSEQLEDEIVSVNAIYSDNTLQRTSESSELYSLLLPGDHHIVLRIEFPKDYPDAPPAILGTESVGETLPKGFGQIIVEQARDVLGQVYSPGSPCIYDLVEDLSSRLEQLLPTISESETTTSGYPQQAAEIGGQHHPNRPNGGISDEDQSLPPLLDKEPPWILSEVITEKKSIFIARAAHVTSVDEAKSYLQHLLATDKKVAKATHNITAWRIQGDNGTAFQDCDDDGETAAGGRLLHLLQLMDVWDVMVVVTRWYGGIHLGPDRFRLINSAARDAVTKGKWVKEASNSKNEKKR